MLARVWAEAAHVRGPRTLGRFLRWLGTAARWWCGQGRGWAPSVRGDGAARAAPPLGVAIDVARQRSSSPATDRGSRPAWWRRRCDTRGSGRRSRSLRLEGDRTLGGVLAAAGPLLAKMDDDDVYGPEHLWDLVLAHDYSRAALVGKFPATVYLARSDRTLRQRRVPGETWSQAITGGTMLLARVDLERAGGWRPMRRHVDRALVEDVLRVGGTVYRTHAAGYLLVRHAEGHTWQRDDADFLSGAASVHPGWQPTLAGLGHLPPPIRGTGP